MVQLQQTFPLLLQLHFLRGPRRWTSLEELVESIRVPSLDPNAAEVFYRVIAKNGSGPSVYVDDLLAKLGGGKPLLLAWGESDPWIRPQAADKIQALYPQSRRVSIDAGHCPHDVSSVAVD